MRSELVKRIEALNAGCAGAESMKAECLSLVKKQEASGTERVKSLRAMMSERERLNKEIQKRVWGDRK